MKRIIRGVLLGLLAVIVIGGVSVWFLLFHSKKPEINTQAYVVDNAGTSYLAVVNEEGTTYAAVTDAEGNVYAAEIKENGDIGETIGKINDQVKITDLPTNYTGQHISGQADINAFTGKASDVVPAQTQPNQPGATDVTGVTQPSGSQQTPASTQNNNGAPTSPSGTPSPSGSSSETPTAASNPTPAAPQKTLHLSKYQEMFQNGTYLMEFKTSDPTLGDTPITAAAKNGNVIIDTKIESYTCKMLYLAKDKTTYLIIDDFKKYCKLPEDLMGDEELDMSAMMANLGQKVDLSKVESSTVSIGGQTLDCETIKDSAGETRYYFSGDTLVRMDNVNSDGTVDSTYISKITSDVPDSTFEIPKNYGYLNLSWLEALA